MHATLHIGTEKTGTTTIQTFLARNRAMLAAAGVLVPVSPGRGNHRLIPGIANDDDILDDLFRERALFEPEARRAAKARWWEAFRAEVGVAGLEHVLISSEHLQSRLRRDGEVERLRDLLLTVFDSVSIVLYLRQPIETAVSLYSTAVKCGGVPLRVPGPNNPYFRNVVHHAETLRRWGAVFGETALTVRLFSRGDFVQGDLIADFIAACGLPALEYVRPAPENESLSALGVAVMREVNVALPLLNPDGTINRQRDGLVPFFERHFAAGPRAIPDAATVTAYETAFAESDNWVRQRFFPGRARLFEPYNSPSSAPAPDPAQVAGIAAAIVELWRQRSSG